ncbi:hypothetical protein F4801DRAFT_580373 [Xylaria longipes]|nr:hypothetical protein F4801DRAFT_580373 [Xylaria longipes]
MASSYAPISAEERSSSKTFRPTTLHDHDTVEPFLDDEDAGDGFFSDEHSGRAQVRGNRLSLIVLLSNFVLFAFAISFYFFQYATAASDGLCQSKMWAAPVLVWAMRQRSLSFSDPIQEATEFEWRQHDSDVLPPDLYGLPTPDRRKLWEKMYEGGSIAFPYNKLDQINKSTDDFEWWTRPPPFNDEVWFQYMYHWDYESVTNMTETIFQLHTNHCYLSLMTIIKCQADMTPVLFQKDHSNHGAWKPSNAPHRCKDFEKLTQWQRYHSICRTNCGPKDLLVLI